jgi:hypothetical protein
MVSNASSNGDKAMTRTVHWKRLGILFALAVAGVIAYPLGVRMFPTPNDHSLMPLQWFAGLFMECAVLMLGFLVVVFFWRGLPAIFNYFFPKKATPDNGVNTSDNIAPK